MVKRSTFEMRPLKISAFSLMTGLSVRRALMSVKYDLDDTCLGLSLRCTSIPVVPNVGLIRPTFGHSITILKVLQLRLNSSADHEVSLQ